MYVGDFLLIDFSEAVLLDAKFAVTGDSLIRSYLNEVLTNIPSQYTDAALQHLRDRVQGLPSRSPLEEQIGSIITSL